MEDRKKQRENTKFIVNGDFNLGFLEAWDPLVISEFLTKNKYRLEKELEISKAKKQAMALLEFTERMNLEQMVKDSTRNDNILDLILTDCMEVIENIVNIKHDKITDHDTLIVELNVQNKNENNEPKKNFCFTEIPLYNINGISSEKLTEAKVFLDSKDWTNATAETLTKAIEETVVKFFEPKVTKKVNKEGKHYKSNNRIPRLVKLNMRRKQLASIALKTVKNSERCRKLRDKISEAEKELSKSHFKYKINKENEAIDKMKENKKYFFTYVKNKQNNKGKIGPFVNKEGKTIDDSAANILQKQYQSVWSKPRKEDIINDFEEYFNDNASSDDITENVSTPKIDNISFTRDKIRKAIMGVKIDAAPGPDGITPTLMRMFCDQILEPLEIIFSDSFEEGIFPKIWKKSDVTPAKKPGKSKSKAESFRPVSLICHFGKIMETIVKKELQEFLEEFGLLSKNQHGFRKGKSCISQLLVHAEQMIQAIENRKNLDSIYLDFQKAFDKADHFIILKRCHEKGIRGKIGTWLSDYLIGRTQRVIANNMVSEEVIIGSGVPQGSVLGPLLFLIIIDNIADLNILANIGIFADDSRLTSEIYNDEDAMNVQEDLEKLYEWADENNMAFNGDKFECIKMGENDTVKNKYMYTIPKCCGSIEDVNNLRDLGILVSDSGDYRDQIYKVVKKVKQRCGWINRSFYNNSLNFKRFMWKTYVQGLLDYGSQVWCPTDPSLIAHLETTQRIFTVQTEGLQHLIYWDRLKEMKLYSVQRRMERYRVIYLWKIMKGLVPNYGIDWDTTERRGTNIKIPKTNYKHSALAKKMRNQSLVVHGGKIFNLLPSDLRNCDYSLEQFKAKLDLFLEQIPDHPASPGLTPVPIDQVLNKHSNSLYDWIKYLKLTDRKLTEEHQVSLK